MPSYYELIKQSKLAGGSGGGSQPILVPKLAIENGTYYPVDDEADGYSSVTVNVPDVNDIAFVPPQKFKSDGSALADYKIYGSNGVKTENKTAVLPLSFTAKAGNAVDWTIEGNDDNGTENLFDYSQGCYWASLSNGLSNQKIIAQQGDVFTVTSTSALYALVRGYNANNALISDSAWSTGGTSTYTAPANIAYVKVVFRNFEYSTVTAEQKATINETMLVKGSTAPDHYIPYQKGVGERTAQLVDKPMFTDGESLDGNGDLVATRYRTTIEDYIPVNDLIYFLWQASISDVGCILCGYNATKSFVSRLFVGNNTAVDVSAYDYIRITMYTNISGYELKIADFSMLSVTNDSTAPQTYIPYGYQIPLTVSQTGQTDKTVDIYIGDSPLTEGETVSKTSTGVDLELFEGENVVSTTLYNKPETAITYIISTGVGEEVSGSYHIPVTINSTTTNVPIGDTPLIEDEYVSYAEQKIYKYVDSVLTPVDPPSALPQISTANGENELSIETEIQPDLVDVALLTPIELIPVALGTKTISANDTYDASDDSLDGYSSVVVNVPSPPAPVLISKSITENGTYTAASDEADGYSEVTVNIRSYSEVLDQGLQATLQEEE